MTQIQNDEKLMAQGYRKAMDLLGECSRPEGFLASPTDDQNYRRIWGRDSVIIGLAALLTDDKELHDTFKRSLETLARHQGPHGEIPSNVDPKSERVSYGGMTGRVDADLWFIIGCGEYWKATGDLDFLGKMLPVIEKVRFLLGAWQFNNRG
ncbi:MAG: amylo-alpha-1,6-glucosidase, partial [Deltaproteobacteria bacterium]